MVLEEEKARKIVREGYAKVARKGSTCCGSESSKEIGYTEEELIAVPEGAANMGLGCGNPVALASLKQGETVLDLGSGGGLDCFLAAKKVGEKGKVIGVDMTPEMIDRARDNAKKSKYKNVEFRLGEIENLPVADNTADVVISNCVINLSPNKKRVFQETFRVLKPGGRLMISDIVLLKQLPEAIRENVEAYIGCVSGAVMKDDYLALIEKAGFEHVKVVEEAHFPVEFVVGDPTAKEVMKQSKISSKKVKELAASIASIRVHGIKPK
jgi:SAM-dependent methyltransferase